MAGREEWKLPMKYKKEITLSMQRVLNIVNSGI